MSTGTGGSSYLPHLARGALINFSGILSHTVCIYLFTFLLARKLSTGELGEYFLITIVINYLALIATVGLGTGVIRYVALYAGEKRYDMARNTVWLSLLIGLPISLLVTVAIFFIAPVLVGSLFDNSPTAANGIRIFAFAIPFLVATQIFISATQGMHRMQYQVYSRDIGEQVSKLGLSGVVLVMGAGLIGVIGATLASVVIAFLMAMVFALNVIPRMNKNSESRLSDPGRSLIVYSLPLAISTMFVALHLKMDTLLLGFLSTTSNVGFYVVVLKISFFSQKITTVFGIVFAPIISDLCNRKKKEDLEKTFKVVSRWIFTFSYPFFLIVLLFAGNIMKLFGSEFVAASEALILLVASYVFVNSIGPVGLMVLMSGRSKLDLFNVTIALVVNVSLCFLLISDHGIMGAAIANAASYIVISIMRVVEVWVLMGIYAFNRGYMKPLFAGAASTIAVALVSRFIVVDINFHEMVTLAIGLCIAYVLIIILLGISDEDKEVLRVFKGNAVANNPASSCDEGG